MDHIDIDVHKDERDTGCRGNRLMHESAVKEALGAGAGPPRLPLPRVYGQRRYPARVPE